MHYLCTAVKIFALIIFVSGCGDIDHDAGPWDLSECVERETIHDQTLDPGRPTLVEIDERTHRAITKQTLNTIRG